MNLIIPGATWQTAIAALRQPPHDRERVAYFDGPRSQHGIGIVTTLTLPNADERDGNFHVNASEMSRAGQHLRRLDLMRFAQIHSHPASWTGHSSYDDEMAFSQRDGAISIIVAHFAGCSPGLADCGVHLRDAEGWRELDRVEKSAVVQIVPSVVDLRQ
jgi:hypothetical protein